MTIGPHVLDLDLDQETARISAFIADTVRGFRRRGAVVGVSGGIDSAVVLALCAHALGPDHTLALLMPERDSSKDATRLGRAVAESTGAPYIIEELAPGLRAMGAYDRQDEAIRQVFPDWATDWKCKLTLPPFEGKRRLPIFRLTVESPDGHRQSSRLPKDAYLKLVAATNYKQRLRKTTEYYHADRLAYAVAGTPNRLEYDQGFFVKLGDGAADFKPIAHLFKSQVYALGRHLKLPDEVCTRPPTTDTFSLPQTQEEFYFSLPWPQMDLCLWAFERRLAPQALAPAVGLSPDQVAAVYADIEGKRRATRYLHAAPVLLEAAPSEAG